MAVATQEKPFVETRLFPESKWTEISGRVFEAFRMTEEEKARFGGGMIAKLIAAIPFLAGCDDDPQELARIEREGRAAPRRSLPPTFPMELRRVVFG